MADGEGTDGGAEGAVDGPARAGPAPPPQRALGTLVVGVIAAGALATAAILIDRSPHDLWLLGAAAAVFLLALVVWLVSGLTRGRRLHRWLEARLGEEREAAGGELRAASARMEDEARALRAALAAGEKRLSERIGVVEEGAFAGHSTALAALEGRIAATEDRLEALSAEIVALARSVEAMAESLHRLEERTGAAARAAEEAGATARAATARLETDGDGAGALAAAERRLGQLHAAQANLAARLDVIAERVLARPPGGQDRPPRG